ncbi:uncharacterized protein LOC134677850 [Cydia fagiglandana]|uniref:uncharacterized protein LOC134677850 n=1 Tax=Cydia fagiglandana TaxID=1458189 RepID=UPI002FEE2487
MSKTSRAVIITTILAASFGVTQSKQTYGNVPDVLKKVLIKYEGIHNNSNNYDKIKDIRRSSSKDTDIEESIRKKINELKPILDDEKVYDRKGKIEFHENGKMESKTGQVDTPNQKYKKLRSEIEKHLKVEPISEETKHIVIEALDQIETELNVNDCDLKKAEGNYMRRGNSRERQPSIVIPNNARTDKILKHLKEKWDKVVSQYSMPADTTNHNDTIRKEAFVFLTQLRQFVFDVHEDYTKLQNTYEIECDSSDKVLRMNSPTFKQENVLDKDDTCIGVKLLICSAELLDFLADFYNQLNETYTEVFKNYIEMYEREIEYKKESFKHVLERTLAHAREKIKEMFSKELEKLNEILDNRSKRADGLKTIIDRTVENSKELIYASLSMKLKKLKPKLRLTIKEDIDVAIGIELGNLQKVYKDKMCEIFRTCNGDIALRKSIITVTTRQVNRLNPNSIKIRLRLGPVVPYKRIKKKHNIINHDHIRKQWKGHTKNALEFNEKVSARKTNILRPFNISEYTHTVNVTRTTYTEFTEKPTTVIVGNLSQVVENVTESDSPVVYY